MSLCKMLMGVIALGAVLMDDAPAAVAWPVPLGASARAVAQSGLAPATPTGATATCVTLASQVTVTWTAVPLATSYTIYDSTTSASSGYTALATGVTGTSWTSGNLSVGIYWFEVAAFIGTNWASPASAATGESVIALICV